MTARDFCYWLQGYFELVDEGAGTKAPTLGPEQVLSIKKHLALVFKHEIDPSAGPPEHQAELNAIHESKTAEELKRLEAMVNAIALRPSGPLVMRC